MLLLSFFNKTTFSQIRQIVLYKYKTPTPTQVFLHHQTSMGSISSKPTYALTCKYITFGADSRPVCRLV